MPLPTRLGRRLVAGHVQRDQLRHELVDRQPVALGFGVHQVRQQVARRRPALHLGLLGQVDVHRAERAVELVALLAGSSGRGCGPPSSSSTGTAGWPLPGPPATRRRSPPAADRPDRRSGRASPPRGRARRAAGRAPGRPAARSATPAGSTSRTRNGSAMSLRTRAWSGSSRCTIVLVAWPCSARPSISSSISGFGVALWMSLDIDGSRRIAATSSKRVTTHPDSRSDQWTGSSSRSRA